MFRKLALTSLVLLALKGGHAQSADISRRETLPVVPEFDVNYDAEMSLVNTKADIHWKSRHYRKNDEYIGEIKGFCNLDIKILFWGVKKVYVGFTTRINYKKNTIETITYNNGADKELNDYEKDIARQESIDTLLADDISLEFADYNSGKLVDVETHRVMDTESYGLQETYFISTRKVNGERKGIDTTFNIHMKGKEYSIPVTDSTENGEKFLYVDLRVNDPDNPENKINMLDQINWLKIYYNNSAVPYKVIGEVVVDAGLFDITKEINITLKQ